MMLVVVLGLIFLVMNLLVSFLVLVRFEIVVVWFIMLWVMVLLWFVVMSVFGFFVSRLRNV